MMTFRERASFSLSPGVCHAYPDLSFEGRGQLTGIALTLSSEVRVLHPLTILDVRIALITTQ